MADILGTGASTQQPNSLGAPGDPYFTNVVLLLHADSVSPIVDSSASAKTMLNASITAGAAKFGASSLAFIDGSYASTPDSNDFNFAGGDFTAEAWIKPIIIPGGGVYTGIVGQRVNSANCGWMLYLNGDNGGRPRFDWTANGSSGGSSILGPVAPTAGVWSHVAVVRFGTTITVYLNGVAGTPVTVGTSVIFDSTDVLSVGRFGSAVGGTFPGSIDELRLTKGVALYTANFTPPTTVFPSSASTAGIVGGVLASGTAASTQIGNVSNATAGVVNFISAVGASLQRPNTSTSTAVSVAGGTAAAVQRLNTQAGLTSDPYLSNVSLLLHGDGSNGSTSFADSSLSPKSLTIFAGAPTLSTAQSMFGGSSILLPAVVSALAFPSAAFQYAAGSQFTVEFFIRLVALPTSEGTVVCLGAPGAGSGNGSVRGGWDVSIPSNGAVKFSAGSTATGTFNVATTAGVLTVGAWNHVAVSVNGSTAPRITINGTTQTLSFYSALSWATVAPSEVNSPSVLIGEYSTASAQTALNAYIDELRITNNVVRYTADFIPPTAAFADASSVIVGGSVLVSAAAASTQALNTTLATDIGVSIGSVASTQKLNTAGASAGAIAAAATTSTQALNTGVASGTVTTASSGTAASTQAFNTATATGTAITLSTGTVASTQALNMAAATGVINAISTGSATSTQALNRAVASAFIPIAGAAAGTQTLNRAAASGLLTNDFSQFVYAQGIAQGPRYGTALVQLMPHPPGFTSNGIGTALVQLMPHPPGFVAGDIGVTFVSLIIRTVSSVGAISPAVVNTPTVEFRIRSVSPVPIAYGLTDQHFGSAVVRDPRRYLAMTGILPGIFGSLTAARNERLIFPTPITGTPGEPTVQFKNRFVATRSVPNFDLAGNATVYNTRQYIAQFADLPAIALYGGATGMPGVANRNRLVHTYGILLPRLPNGANVENTARLLNPQGITGATGTAFASFRVRTIYPPGTDNSYLTRWHATYNALRRLEPSGIGRGSAGVPYVHSNTQTISHNGAPNLFISFGAATATFRIRTVALSRFDGIAPGRFGDVFPHLYTRYVKPPGIAGVFGAVFAETHRNIITLHGIDEARYGDAIVVNRTPELRASPWTDDVFGKPYAGLYRRFVNLAGQGANDSGFGRLYTGQRTRRVAPNGVLMLRIPLLHDVRIDEPQIPPRQIVAQAYGIRELTVYGVNTVYNGGILPFGRSQLLFGLPSVSANSITDAKILLDQGRQFGIPSLNGTRWVYPKSLGDMALAGKPLASPFYLYISDGPGELGGIGDRGVVDYLLDHDPYIRPFFGNAQVTLSRRTIYPYPVNDGVVENSAFVAARVRTIALTGFKGKMGYLEIAGGDLTVSPYWGLMPNLTGSFDAALYGSASVDFPPTLPLGARPSGVNNEIFGNLSVDLFNRTIRLASFYTTIFTGDTHVGPPVPIVPTGIEPPTFNATTWASLLIRQVLTPGIAPAGFDYVPGSTNFKTLVVRVQLPSIRPAGITPGSVSFPTAKLGRLGATLGMGNLSRFGRPIIGDCPVC